jgi:hypothetical protein
MPEAATLLAPGRRERSRTRGAHLDVVAHYSTTRAKPDSFQEIPAARTRRRASAKASISRGVV